MTAAHSSIHSMLNFTVALVIEPKMTQWSICRLNAQVLQANAVTDAVVARPRLGSRQLQGRAKLQTMTK